MQPSLENKLHSDDFEIFHLKYQVVFFIVKAAHINTITATIHAHNGCFKT